MTFKEGQEVMVLQVTVNGLRRDVIGRYVSPGRGSNKDKHIVTVNGVRIHVSADKLKDAQEYWNKKNRGD